LSQKGCRVRPFLFSKQPEKYDIFFLLNQSRIRSMLSGSCLCGEVTFSLAVSPKFFYRCHCSLCRKQSGVGHNLATLVRAADFSWQSGEEAIASWIKPTGYRNDFCKQCGSSVPNLLRNLPYIWLPLGLLDDAISPLCIGDYCADDAMPWDDIPAEKRHAQATESVRALLDKLEVP
jgi:hypothetical protein